MKVCAVIPARMGSTRLEGKPLIELCGKSMIQRVYEQVQTSTLIHRTIVATDHPDIKKHVEDFGGDVMMTSESCQNGTERVFEVASEYSDYDLYVNVQGDEPLIDASVIDQTITGLIQHEDCQIGTISTTSVQNEEFENPNRVKVVRNQHKEALYFSRSPIPHHRDAVNSIGFLIHIGLYVFRKEFILNLQNLADSYLEDVEKLEQLKFMDNGYRIHVEDTNYRSIGVDTKDDIKIVENILMGKPK